MIPVSDQETASVDGGGYVGGVGVPGEAGLLQVGRDRVAGVPGRTAAEPVQRPVKRGDGGTGIVKSLHRIFSQVGGVGKVDRQVLRGLGESPLGVTIFVVLKLGADGGGGVKRTVGHRIGLVADDVLDPLDRLLRRVHRDPPGDDVREIIATVQGGVIQVGADQGSAVGVCRPVIGGDELRITDKERVGRGRVPGVVGILQVGDDLGGGAPRLRGGRHVSQETALSLPDGQGFGGFQEVGVGDDQVVAGSRRAVALGEILPRLVRLAGILFRGIDQDGVGIDCRPSEQAVEGGAFQALVNRPPGSAKSDGHPKIRIDGQSSPNRVVTVRINPDDGEIPAPDPGGWFQEGEPGGEIGVLGIGLRILAERRPFVVGGGRLEGGDIQVFKDDGLSGIDLDNRRGAVGDQEGLPEDRQVGEPDPVGTGTGSPNQGVGAGVSHLQMVQVETGQGDLDGDGVGG